MSAMLSRRPMLRVDPNVLNEKLSSVEPEYPHTSVFRSSQAAEVHVRSPSVKVVTGKGYDSAQSLPVFGDHDKVTGSVLLDVSLCATPGRLTISLQGTFVYMSPNAGQSDSESYVALSRPERHRHVFFSSSETRPTGDLGSPRSSTSLRDAFAASVRYRRERRPSQTSLKGALRPFPFSFAIPRPEQSGQELPPTFSSIATGECGPRGRTCIERAEVSYAVIATWEAADGVDRAFVEAPILYQPDADFQSLDGLAMQKDSWLEIPLKSDRPLPVACAVTLPHPVTFSRSGSIPYFVVFTTNPRSATLVREIATDATISVSLQREVRVDAATPLYATPSPTGTPSTSSDESESVPPVSSRRLLKRVVTARSAPASLARARQLSKEKPLPQLPSPAVNESRALHVDMCIGFPKRPRYRCEPHQKHPPLESHASLPDGLYKGKIQLDKHMLPAFDWAGLRVKYYLDVSVIFGQDQMRARVPLRIS